jgi:hypothetical protein
MDNNCKIKQINYVDLDEQYKNLLFD